MPFTFTHPLLGIQLDKKHTALVLVDIQNEFLTESKNYYPMVADKLKELNVFDHIEELLKNWVAQGSTMVDYLSKLPNGFVSRKDPVDLEGFVGSGADYPERLKKYLMDKKTLCLRRIEKVIMAGPVGNLCLENHIRDIIEAGFEVVMVRDAISAGRNEEGDGYEAVLVNYRFMANAVWTTEDIINRMNATAANK
ncbi:Isochorismatase-like protein [Xylogone sp. PMI_703]|nr:Isochorismatase-like protein [Xylogone sp. PMI_703]